MTDHHYSAADLTVLSMTDAVRRRPGMFFAPGPDLATRVLCTVIGHAFHPAATVAAAHTPRVVADITAGLAFSVTDDQAAADPDRPRLGYDGTLLTPERWSYAAAVAVSTHTSVETWRDGRGFRQSLTGLHPLKPPEPLTAPAGAGTRVAYVLDPAFFGPAAITADLAALDVHGPRRTAPSGPGEVLIRDHRHL
ncbi:hypothetical protein [Paractinoplanes atraurantiacus]|uniref:Uncharacterized protein n=1 Tax=Paractinoplanes atraurantiacus TaxID=1036182 RepID=A0A285IAE8_9ACTN|nr:hypothetical protein [Actinoplanes atraurantiacus]SNY44938.1 hypothetical protein SAMN05421748_107146 [Actinoplanes atraurantiacus]